MIYIKLYDPRTRERRQSLLRRILIRALRLFLPLANPDFEDRISDVAVWLLEFEDENSTPDREIGLDSTAHVIVKMPYKRNYGYWTDNNLKLPDFQSQFKTELISKEQFDERWSSAFDE